MPWGNKFPDLKNDPSYLDPRLTAVEQKASSNAASLAEKANQSDLNTTNQTVAAKADKTYVDTQIGSVNAGPKGTYATLSALQSAFPTGTSGIYIVTADGKWYFWNGSAWTAGGVYQSTGIANNSITSAMTTALGGFAAIHSYNGLINFDFVNHHVYFPAGSVRFKNNSYAYAAQTLDYSTDFNSGSIDFTIFYNTSTNTFNYKVTSTLPNTTEAEILIGVFRTAGTINILAPYSVNGVKKVLYEIPDGGLPLSKFDPTVGKRLLTYTYLSLDADFTVLEKQGSDSSHVYFKIQDTKYINVRPESGYAFYIQWESIKSTLSANVVNVNGVGYLDIPNTYVFVVDGSTGNFAIVARTILDPFKHVTILSNDSGVVTNGDVLKWSYRNGNRDGGYVTNNQLTTTLNSFSTLPSYALTGLEGMAAKVQEVQTATTLSFGFITDTHYISDTALNADSLPHTQAAREMSKYASLKFMAHGGDVVDGYRAKSTTLADLRRTVKTMVDSVNCPLVVLKGNHDDNSQYANANGKLLKDMLTPTEWYSATVKYFENKVVTDPSNPTGGYYYMDDDSSQIRTVFLNSLDMPYIDNGDGTTKYLPIFEYAYSNAQLNWLANTALNFSTKSNPSQWAVVVISHVALLGSLSFGDPEAHNTDVVRGILTAYKSGSSYASTPTTGDFAQSVSVDFSSQGVGQIIACIFGHVHWDKIDVIDGVTYVACINSLAAKAQTVNAGATVYDRSYGTSTSDGWTVFTVDRSKRIVYGHRYGVGTDFQFTY